MGDAKAFIKQFVVEKRSETSFKNILASALNITLEIEWHSSKKVFLHYKKKQNNKGILSLDTAFLCASDAMIVYLVRYLSGSCKKALMYLRCFVAQEVFAKKERILAKQVIGKVYDLRKVYSWVEQQYLPYPISADISWFTPRKRTKKRSLTYGRFCARKKQIFINRLLDTQEVPEYFLEYVIYHEALHAICPPEIGNYKMSIHTKQFQYMEKQFPYFAKAKNFQQIFFQEYRG